MSSHAHREFNWTVRRSKNHIHAKKAEGGKHTYIHVYSITVHSDAVGVPELVEQEGHFSEVVAVLM